MGSNKPLCLRCWMCNHCFVGWETQERIPPSYELTIANPFELLWKKSCRNGCSPTSLYIMFVLFSSNLNNIPPSFWAVQRMWWWLSGGEPEVIRHRFGSRTEIKESKMWKAWGFMHKRGGGPKLEEEWGKLTYLWVTPFNVSVVAVSRMTAENGISSTRVVF